MAPEIVPILDKIKELYSQPRSLSRFKEYLNTLQGNSPGDMALPIQGFNPMAKEHILAKIEELQLLDAETVMGRVLSEMKVALPATTMLKVVLNLADDQLGGWTDRFATDYDSKFKLNALVTRGFVTPYFWSSEVYTTALIEERTQEAVYRTAYWLSHPRPRSLADFVGQEAYVARHMRGRHMQQTPKGFEAMKAYVKEHGEDEAYPRLFNFFYGDEASASLGYASYGIGDMNGFAYARQLASHS